MLTRKSAIKKVEKFAREIKASGVQLRRVVLFGSYAHGKPHKLSDIDVALAADEFTYDEFNNTRYFVRIKTKPAYSITPPTPTIQKILLHVSIRLLK